MNNMEFCKSISLLVFIGAAFAGVASASSDEIKIDGRWDEWSKWSNCRAKCGDGIRYRIRYCREPKHGGKPCHGNDYETKWCNDKNMTVDGRWDEWSEWSKCRYSAADCMDEMTTRRRICIEPKYGGLKCQLINSESKRCHKKCIVDGRWNEWSKWSKCSSECGVGITARKRYCFAPLNGGKPCHGNDSESKTCHNKCIVRNLAVAFNESEFQLRPSYKVVGRFGKRKITHVSGMKFKESLTVNEIKELLSSVFTNAKRIGVIRQAYGYALNGDKVIQATSAEGGAPDSYWKWIFCDRDGNRYKRSELKTVRTIFIPKHSDVPFPLFSDCRSVICVSHK